MAKTICSVADCGKNAVGRKLCRTHYARFMRNGTLEYVKPLRDMSQDTSTHKTCTRCKELKTRTDYYTASRNKDGKRATCKQCDNKANTSGYNLNREDILAKQLERSQTPEGKAYRAAYMPDYYEANRSRYMEVAAQRRSRERDAFVDSGITVHALRKRHGDNCEFCHVPMIFTRSDGRKYHPQRATIEHMTPLIHGGKHSWDNTRLSCLTCNFSKGAKTPAQFMEFRARGQRQ